MLNRELPYEQAIPLISIYPKELKTSTQTNTSTHTYSNIICNSHWLETIQMSINRRMDTNCGVSIL